MKTIRLFKTRGLTLILVSALGVSIGFASPAFAQAVGSGAVIVNPDGKVTYLGTLGGDVSFVSAINDSGQVVGSSTTADGSTHAFITGPDGMGMTDLGTLGSDFSVATGINDSGQVVGYSSTGELDQYGNEVRHAFITGPSGQGMTDLGTLGGAYSEAYGINDSGQAVGYSPTADNFSGHAFITGPNGMGMTDLGTLGSDFSLATNINDSGQVVGFSTLNSSPNHAFITGPNGVGMTGLGPLSENYSIAHAINDSGQVVGLNAVDVHGSFRQEHAFITGTDGMGMTDLGTLGGDRSYALGINDSGQVVGGSGTANRMHHDHAFITGPNGVGMTDLNSIVVLPSGLHLDTAVDINNLGQVIAFMAPIPEPASYALMLAGLGLVGFMARSKNRSRRVLVRQRK